MGSKTFTVLMAEDDIADIMAAERAWEEHKIVNPLRVVRDGEECLDYLHQRGKYSEAERSPRAGLLLLDLKMPKLDGLGVLKHIRENADEGIRRLPVVILTSSKSEEERLASYDLGVNAFIVKPVGFENLAAAVKTINLFWELAELP